MDKQCTKCKQTKQLTDFYVGVAYCKVCSRAISREWRRLNKDKKQAQNKDWKQKHKQQRAEYRKQYRKDNRLKCNAHSLVWNHINTGKLFKPDFCYLCGDKCEPQAHHEDYSKPLEILWLCPTCHANRHKK